MIIELLIRLFIGEPVPSSPAFVPDRLTDVRDGDWYCTRCTSVMRRYRRTCAGCGTPRARKAPR